MIIIRAARLAKEGKKLEDLIKNLAEPMQSVELRFNITEPDFAAAGNKILSDLEAYAVKMGWKLADDSREGVRVSFERGSGDGWFLLRLSVHDPVMPLNIESDVKEGCKVIAVQLLDFIKTCKGLDISALEAYLGL
jgi:phosphomannomutase